jgi:hypothetical protein
VADVAAKQLCVHPIDRHLHLKRNSQHQLPLSSTQEPDSYHMWLMCWPDSFVHTQLIATIAWLR